MSILFYLGGVYPRKWLRLPKMRVRIVIDTHWEPGHDHLVIMGRELGTLASTQRLANASALKALTSSCHDYMRKLTPELTACDFIPHKLSWERSENQRVTTERLRTSHPDREIWGTPQGIS